MTHLVRWLSRALPCVAVVTAACTEPAPEPPPEPPPPRTSPLAACADPAVALTPRWQVDNLHAPVTAIATSGATLVVGSADGAVKLWHLSTTGAIERRPGYGTPLREAGPTVATLAATADGALAAVDQGGAATAWRLDGTPLGGAATAVPGRPVGAALAPGGELLAVAGDDLRTQLTVVDLTAGTATAATPTWLWHTTTAAVTTERVVAVGDWYGCPAIETRPRGDLTANRYWDDCNGAGGALRQGWFRALALTADGRGAIAAGDRLLARFDLDDLTAGPRAVATVDVDLRRVVLLEADGLLVTLGGTGDGTALTWWRLDDLVPVRTEPVEADVDLAVEPTTGVAILVAASGVITGLACAP